ncbi:MAG: imidazoleglycerol-phosphate dehydratase HisB [Clostridia bacterium]|nr:imidazoleglycerol-phosphate dehydratase HisB [Clostridia bacterium]
MRCAVVKRTTKETDIDIALTLEGTGKSTIDTGVPFLDHMLTLFASHGCFDLEVKCRGDIEVDYHHSVEDIGIALGEAFAKSLGDKKGIKRYGDTILPMDESLILTAIDLSGRTYLSFCLRIPAKRIGSFDTELVCEFFWGFVRSCPSSLHIKKLAGTNSHHIIEGAFKSFARTMREAVSIDEGRRDAIPSTKGVL